VFFIQVDRRYQPGLLEPLQQSRRKNRSAGIAGLVVFKGLLESFSQSSGIQVKLFENQDEVILRFLEEFGNEMLDPNFIMGPGDTQTGGIFKNFEAKRMQTVQQGFYIDTYHFPLPWSG